MGGPPGPKITPVGVPSMPIMQFLGPHGASLGAPKALLSSNLVPLSPPSSVKLPLLAPTCALTSQLSLNFGLNLPSKLIFHWFCNLPNLDFCNTLQCFSWFFYISANRLEDGLRSQKSPLMWLQKAPKSLPRGLQETPRALQEAPRALHEAPRAPQDRENSSLRTFSAPHKTHKMTQDTSKSSQEARKRSPRGRQVAPRGSQGTPIGLPELSKKSNRASLSLCNHFAFFAFTDFQIKTTHPQYIQAWPGGMRVAFEYIFNTWCISYI